MLLTLLAISVVSYAGLLTALLFQLERRNPATWRELGSPSWFLMPYADSWALLKFLFTGTRRDELHATVRHLVAGTRLTLLLTVVFILLLGLQQGSGPGPEG